MNTPNTSSTINRHHWIVAASLAALTCGVSCEEAEVETNDQKLLALCKDPEATPEAIESLLKAGADIEARDKDGETPLIIAARSNNPEVIEVLLTGGANAKAKNEAGETALDYAKKNKKIYKTKLYWKLNDLQYE